MEPGRPWSEATFGGGTSFEVQSFVVQPGLEEPPGMPVPEPWPEVPAPLLGLLLGEVAARCWDLGKDILDTRSRRLQYFDVFYMPYLYWRALHFLRITNDHEGDFLNSFFHWSLYFLVSPGSSLQPRPSPMLAPEELLGSKAWLEAICKTNR